MKFSKRKLPIEATSELRMCSIETVKPYALMIAPVYVFMPKNAKYVAVKGPLDFFTNEELARLKSFETLFMPEFVESVLPYRQIARRIKRVLGFNADLPAWDIGPSPYEFSDAVVRLLAPLWGAQFAIESYFVSIFTNELCDLLPTEDLNHAREDNLDHFECSLMISAWMVLLSVQLGMTDLNYLNALRLASFRRTPQLILDADARELYELLEKKLGAEKTHRQSLGLSFFDSRSERVAQKLTSRLKRVQETPPSVDPLEASALGPEGFVDV